MSQERVQVDAGMVGDTDLARLAFALAWEASALGWSESASLLLFELAEQCREVGSWRRAMLAAMEQDLGEG